MDGLHALRCHGRTVVMENDRCIAVLQNKRARRNSIHGEVASLQGSWIHWIADVDCERCGLTKHNATSCWDRARDDQTAARDNDQATSGRPEQHGDQELPGTKVRERRVRAAIGI